MGLIADARRLGRLGWADRALLVEALLALALASAAIRILPFRKVMAHVGKAAAPRQGSDGDRIARVRWAVEAVARRVPWRAVCFQKGVAAHRMLRRRGVPTQLHYGARIEGGVLKAHVWVTAGGEDVIGGAEAIGFPCLATYG